MKPLYNRLLKAQQSCLERCFEMQHARTRTLVIHCVCVTCRWKVLIADILMYMNYHYAWHVHNHNIALSYKYKQIIHEVYTTLFKQTCPMSPK